MHHPHPQLVNKRQARMHPWRACSSNMLTKKRRTTHADPAADMNGIELRARSNEQKIHTLNSLPSTTAARTAHRHQNTDMDAARVYSQPLHHPLRPDEPTQPPLHMLCDKTLHGSTP
jgi:hypothetical protein